MPLQLDPRQRAMLQEMGVRVWLPGTHFDPLGHSAVAPASPTATESPAQASAPAATPVVNPPVRPPLKVAPAAQPTAVLATPASDATQLDWSALQSAVSQCQACGLCAGRTRTTLQAAVVEQCDWMVVGDAPDEDEDRAGHAFAESAGMLLDNMLKAVGARRGGAGAQGAYATNIVKCRPAHGQVPQVSELSQCAAYLQREIALVQPKIIIAMGRFAIQGLLSDQPDLATLPLGRLRGTVHRYQGVPLVVTYAPKMLLRASADKAKAWADLCLAMDTLAQAQASA